MRILVVEDERKVASFIKNGLEEERYIVETAPDGEAGLDIALNNHFDAIVLDVMLPKKDGFSVLKELQGRRQSHVRTHADRSRHDRRQSHRARSRSRWLSLPKPFHFEELAARLRSIMRRSSTEKPTKLTCADLVLDTVSHVASDGIKK